MVSLFKKKILCPYCNNQLDKAPKRKSKCPHCQKYIYIREGKLVTEEEASISDWVIRLAEFDITRQKFNKERENLSQRFKTKASVNDTVWSILNIWIDKHPGQQSVEFAYHTMASLAYQEGKDDKPYIEHALRSQLIRYKLERVKKVKVSNVGGRNDNPSTCPQCKKLHGKKFNIDEALEKMPIPRNCTAEDGCRCSYELIDPIESM